MPTSSKCLIYVVEDDEDDRLLLHKTLHHQPVNCLIQYFTHGAELFIRLTHQLDGRLPDLIFLDLDTPTMNGFDTLKLLKQMPEYRHIPVVIRTGHESLEHINRCYELGCQAYLTKRELGLPLTRMIGERRFN